MTRHVAWWIVVAAAVGVGLVWPGLEALAQGPRIVVEDAWARPLPPVVKSGELYMTIRNTGNSPDRLVGGRSPACGVVEKITGFHLMCMDRTQEFTSGARFSLKLKFEKSGEMPVQVTIRDR